MIKKVLIANRSEIAVRIIRAAQEEGIETVAIYSDVDNAAVHVRMADNSYNIGPAPAIESYLNQDKIIETAIKSGCQAIHPGYGFLAENSGFAKKVEDAGLIFIGPCSTAIAAMGDKLQARELMIAAGVPVVPGTSLIANNSDTVLSEAGKLGYPVLVKAAGGGGGKGIRLVHEAKDLLDAIAGATREAKSAFSDDRVYIEKYLENPRHIEIQVLADSYGKTLHFYERECSIQRRHQKIIEETPSTVLSEATRTKMGEAAVKAAQAVGYKSAGTCEFLYDKYNNFYFLEMNTRIQVEHPVTEFITGYDLVRLQFQIANGHHIGFNQNDIPRIGHAIECRIYAEDPDNKFLPSPGILHFVKMPSGPGVRVDSGIESGLEVSIYYDPILAKIICYGQNREIARQRMIRALKETVILGVITPIPFLIEMLQHPAFIEGKTYTSFLQEHGFMTENRNTEKLPDELLTLAANIQNKKLAIAESSINTSNPWTEIGKWGMGR